MSDMESEENKCRICLEENADVHWNTLLYDYSDLTYKDCYYKYTQLEYFEDEDDNFSTMLCHNCTDSFKYVDTFITKAVETHVMCNERLHVNIVKDDDDVGSVIMPETTTFETILVEESDIKPEVQNSPMYGESDEVQNSPMYEVSDEEYLVSEEDNSGRRSETPNKQTRKQRKRKSVKINKAEDSQSSTDQKAKRTYPKICCTICSKVLASKYKAIKHEKTHIENRERNETCAECGLKFFSKEILRSHMLTHEENREKAHKCEFCDKAFFSKGGLNVHRRIHLGQMVSCSLCTKEFYRQCDLDKHMNSHSAVQISATIKTRSRCYIRCTDCGKNIRSTSFKFHNAMHMNEPLFKCTICDKEFFHRSSCTKHLKRTHKKPNGDVNNFIIAYKKNRFTHLYLQQNANIIKNTE